LGFARELTEYPRPIEEAILAIRDALATGKVAGISTPNSAAAKTASPKGSVLYAFICVQNDFGMIQAAAAETIRKLRR
jgi:hypothetical protein